MKKTILLLFIFSLSVTAQAQTSDLIGMLTKEMGITTGQAEGGAGSLFGLAKEGMPKSDFGDLTKIIPDMNGLLGAIPSSGSSGMMGSLSKQLVGMPAVVDAFTKLGLKESHIAIMSPLLASYVEKKGTQALSKVFAKSIGL